MKFIYFECQFDLEDLDISVDQCGLIIANCLIRSQPKGLKKEGS